MMTDSEIELFIKQHASIEKGITLAIAWQQVLVLRYIADTLMEMANPVMKVGGSPGHDDYEGSPETDATTIKPSARP